MKSKKVNAPLGASLVVLSSLFYASYGIWTKLMGDFFGGYTASAIRSVLVLVILVPIALAFRQLGRIGWRRNWRYLAGMTAAGTVVWGPFYYAILHAGVGIALTINYACIVIGMFLFGWLLAKERFTKDKWLSSALGIVGLLLVFGPSLTGGIGWLALVAAVVSGLGCAAGVVLAKQIPYNATQSTTVFWATSVVANIPMAFALREVAPDFGWQIEWLYLAIFAVASVSASWLLVRGIKLIDAGAAGILGLLEIVFGVLFGLIFFNEKIGPIAALGIFVIIAAAAIPYVKDYNSQKGTLEEAKS